MVDDILGKHAQSSAQSDNFDTNLIQYPQSAVQHHGERLCVGGLQGQTESCRQEWEGQTDLLGQSNINCIEHWANTFSFPGIRVRCAKSWSDKHSGLEEKEKQTYVQ